LTDLHLVRKGDGPPVLFVHGSAADQSTWVMQLATLPAELTCIAYDRRGSGASPDAPAGYRVEDHAADAAAILEAVGEPALVVGSSYGSVILLELCRTRPELVRGAVLCEPPMPCADDLPAMPAGFGCDFDARVAAGGGPAAGEMFMRLVVGDAAFERMPARWRELSVGQWRQIRADCLGLSFYRPRYRELGTVDLPVLLVGGARSNPYFDPTLDSLELALPRARRVTLAGAGHMMHAEAARAFADALRSFSASI
jgi:pimeloyl-ACP methyl ester carboxylesterase